MKKSLVFLFFSIFLAGCEKPQEFDIIKNNDGSFYRLNKKTGEMAQIKDGVITQIKDQKTIEEEQQSAESQVSQLAELKNWPVLSIPKKSFFIDTGTNWRNDQINISVKISPKEALEKLENKVKILFSQYSELYDKYNRSGFSTQSSISAEINKINEKLESLNNSSITLTAFDKAGMPITKFDIKVRALTETHDDNNQIAYYSCQLSNKLSKEDYLAIDGISLGWNIEGDLLEDLNDISAENNSKDSLDELLQNNNIFIHPVDSH
jgi:hypothetical protein